MEFPEHSIIVWRRTNLRPHPTYSNYNMNRKQTLTVLSHENLGLLQIYLLQLLLYDSLDIFEYYYIIKSHFMEVNIPTMTNVTCILVFNKLNMFAYVIHFNIFHSENQL